MLKEFKSLLDLEETLKTEDDCVRHFVAIRWPEGAACPHCGGMDVYELSKIGQYKCAEKLCAKKFGYRYDTIFADAKIPLRTWYRAIFLMTSHKKGISSHQLARDIGITQKSAWHMLHRVREATMTPEFRQPLMTGTIEADETFIGGKEQFKHANKRTPFSEGRGSIRSKTAVFGMVSHSGELRLHKMTAVNKKEVQHLIIHSVRGGSKIHTDEATHYKWMHQRYEHTLVKHRFGQYVTDDGVTTNRIEGAFSHFKRAVVGVYHKVSDEHIDRYLGMFSWRWTRRKMGEGERLNALLKTASGRQLPYRKLTRKD